MVKKQVNYSLLKRRLKSKEVAIDKLFKPWRSLSRILSVNDQTVFTLFDGVGLVLITDEARQAVVIKIFTQAAMFNVTISLLQVRDIHFYQSARTLIINYNMRSALYCLGFAHIYKLLRIFGTMFCIRMRVKGRLYRIYKRNGYRDLQYRFGHTHIVTVYVDGFYAKYIRKKKIRIFGYDFYALAAKAIEIKSWFPRGLYTNVGLFQGGKRLYSKQGKSVKYF